MAVNGRLNEEVFGAFVKRLGQVLYQRNITRNEAEKIVAELRSGPETITLDKENSQAPRLGRFFRIRKISYTPGAVYRYQYTLHQCNKQPTGLE